MKIVSYTYIVSYNSYVRLYPVLLSKTALASWAVRGIVWLLLFFRPMKYFKTKGVQTTLAAVFQNTQHVFNTLWKILAKTENVKLEIRYQYQINVICQINVKKWWGGRFVYKLAMYTYSNNNRYIYHLEMLKKNHVCIPLQVLNKSLDLCISFLAFCTKCIACIMQIIINLQLIDFSIELMNNSTP